MAWPNIRAKSSLTGGGLGCRLAWQTVCVDQGEFGWTTAAPDSWTGKHAGTQIEEAELESWAFRICPLLCFTAALCLQICSTSPTCPVSECLLYHHPICSQTFGPPERLAAWARRLLSKIIPSHHSFSSRTEEGHAIYWMLLHNPPTTTWAVDLFQTKSKCYSWSHQQRAPPTQLDRATLYYTGPVPFHRDAHPMWFIWRSEILWLFTVTLKIMETFQINLPMLKLYKHICNKHIMAPVVWETSTEMLIITKKNIVFWCVWAKIGDT